MISFYFLLLGIEVTDGITVFFFFFFFFLHGPNIILGTFEIASAPY